MSQMEKLPVVRVAFFVLNRQVYHGDTEGTELHGEKGKRNLSSVVNLSRTNCPAAG